MSKGHVAEYFKLIFQQIRLSQEYYKRTYPYKYINVEPCPKTGEEKIVVQVVWKNIYLTFTPKELAEDEHMLSGFSPLDIRTITRLATKSEIKREGASSKKIPLYKIVAQHFSKKFRKEIIILANQSGEKHITKSAQELSRDNDLLNKLDPLDANRVGFTAGYEQAQKDSVINDKQSQQQQ